MVEAARGDLPRRAPEILAHRAVHAVLDEQPAVLGIVDVQTPRALNGHAEENDGACGPIHRVIQRLLAFTVARGRGREADVHALQVVAEVVLQQVQRAARVELEPGDAAVGVGQLRTGGR